MSHRDDRRKLINDLAREKAERIIASKSFRKIKDSLYEVRVYLEQNKKEKTPMSYDMVKELFGGIEAEKAEEVLNNAILNSSRRRLKEAVQDSKQGDGKNSG